MKKYIRNLEESVSSVLNESLVDDAAELLGIEQEEAEDRIKGLSFANYLELGNAIDMEDAETVREILSTVAPFTQPANEVDLEEEAPPGMEDWIVKRKPEFKKRYGSDWEKVLYATAWKQHNNESIEEDIFDEEKLLDKPTPSLKDLAKKHDKSLADMGVQLTKGIKVELEHTGDRLIAKEIALDHLNELPDYYDRLAKMEKSPVKEADNPFASAPSQGSSVDALAKQTSQTTQSTNATQDNEEGTLGRKDVEDLMVGDDIEVIDIDGDPTPVTVKTAKGPGDTLVVQTDKGEEHIVKKQAVSGTPELQEMYERALSGETAFDGFVAEGMSDEDETTLEAALMQEDYYDSEGEGAELAKNLATYGWVIYISWNRDDLDYAMYKNMDKDNNRGDYRFLKVDKATGSWQMQRTKRNNDMATESGDAPELMHVIKAIESSATVDEARNASNTEHSGAKKGKGGYYGRKKDAKSDSNKKRRANDKKALDEADDFSFYVEPDGRGGGAVMTSDGDIHDYYDDVEDARQDAERLNAEYGKVDEEFDPATHVKVEYRGPGDTVVVQTDKGEEHIVKKQAVSGTPTIQEMYEAALEEDKDVFHDKLKGTPKEPLYVGFDQSGDIERAVNVKLKGADHEIHGYDHADRPNLIKVTVGDYDDNIRDLFYDKDLKKIVDPLDKDFDAWMDQNPFESINEEERLHKLCKRCGKSTSVWQGYDEAYACYSCGNFDDGEEAAYESALTDRVHEAYNANKTEHSGAKKGKGGYYGRKKDAKRDSNKKRRSNDKEAMTESERGDYKVHYNNDKYAPDFVSYYEPSHYRADSKEEAMKKAAASVEEHEREYVWPVKATLVKKYYAIGGPDNDEEVLVDDFNPATHVNVEHRDPEGRFIIVHAPPAGYWAVGKGDYKHDVDATAFDNFDDALEHAELCLASLDEAADLNKLRRLAGLKETASGGATGAGAVAVGAVAVGGPHGVGGSSPIKRQISSNPSIYGKTTKKPKPKERAKESTNDGIGRSKKQ